MIFERRLKPHIHVDLTPLIDVVFQLVIFFMISSVFNIAPGISLKLPQSATAENVEITELRLTVLSEQEIFVNKEACTLKTLEEALKQVMGQSSLKEPVAVLDGKGDIPYQLMIDILDALRKEGLDAVNLITTRNKDEK